LRQFQFNRYESAAYTDIQPTHVAIGRASLATSADNVDGHPAHGLYV